MKVVGQKRRQYEHTAYGGAFGKEGRKEPHGQSLVVPTFQRQRGKEEPWKQRGEGPERWAENREKTTWEL